MLDARTDLGQVPGQIAFRAATDDFELGVVLFERRQQIALVKVVWVVWLLRLGQRFLGRFGREWGWHRKVVVHRLILWWWTLRLQLNRHLRLLADGRCIAWLWLRTLDPSGRLDEDRADGNDRGRLGVGCHRGGLNADRRLDADGDRSCCRLNYRVTANGYCDWTWLRHNVEYERLCRLDGSWCCLDWCRVDLYRSGLIVVAGIRCAGDTRLS